MTLVVYFFGTKCRTQLLFMWPFFCSYSTLGRLPKTETLGTIGAGFSRPIALLSLNRQRQSSDGTKSTDPTTEVVLWASVFPDSSYQLKADTHYPYIRPVRTGCLYGPYVWVHFLTTVRTARTYG